MAEGNGTSVLKIVLGVAGGGCLFVILGIGGCMTLIGLGLIGAKEEQARQQAAAPASSAGAPVVNGVVPQPGIADGSAPAVKADTPPANGDMPQQAEAAVSEPVRIGKSGERVEAGGIALTVVGVERLPSLNEFMKAGTGKTYLVVDVVIEATTRDKAPYNPFYFKVKDSEGFEATAGLGGNDSLKSGELAKGEKVRGKVTFEIAEGARGLVLSYQPLVLLGGYEPIRVALE